MRRLPSCGGFGYSTRSLILNIEIRSRPRRLSAISIDPRHQPSDIPQQSRRHAYVCAKCHEGASASYAAYVVHAPNPALASTFKDFPVLAYAFWIMVAIAVGTFVLFLPHTILWGIRELFTKKKTKEKKTIEPDSKNAD